MKKTIAFLLAMVMVFTMCACGGKSAPTTAGKDSGTAGASTNEPAEQTDGTVYTLRLSTTRAENTWFAKMYDDLAADLEERSDGRLKIEVFHNNTLGAPADIWSMFTTGSIDMLDMSPGMVGSFPVSEVFNVPFVFDNNQQVGDMMWELYNANLLPEYSDNMKVLMFLPAGPLELCSKKKVESIADLKGMKLRGSSKTINDAIELLGGTAVSIQPSEQSMALSQGILDGVITGANFAEIQSVYESCGYLMNYNIGMSCMFLGINPASYEKLPEDLQKLLVDATQELYEGYYMETLETEYTAVLDRLANEHGMEVYKPSDQLVADMEKATASQWDNYVKSLSDAGMDADAIMEIINSYVQK